VTVTGTGITDGDNIGVTVTDRFGIQSVQSAATTVSGGAWQATIDVSSLPDGWIRYSVYETNPGGAFHEVNGDGLKGPTLTLTSAPDITADNVTSVTVSGTGAIDGDTIDVAIGDGTTVVFPSGDFVTVQGGTWSVSGIDASSLKDGPITYDATENDKDFS